MSTTIITLHESAYPVIPDERPLLHNLPLGLFNADPSQVGRLLAGDDVRLSGVFYYTNRREGDMPRVGKPLLAMFSYEGERYIYESTLAFPGTDFTRKRRWPATLGLTKLIKKW